MGRLPFIPVDRSPLLGEPLLGRGIGAGQNRFSQMVGPVGIEPTTSTASALEVAVTSVFTTVARTAGACRGQAWRCVCIRTLTVGLLGYVGAGGQTTLII